MHLRLWRESVPLSFFPHSSVLWPELLYLAAESQRAKQKLPSGQEKSRSPPQHSVGQAPHGQVQREGNRLHSLMFTCSHKDRENCWEEALMDLFESVNIYYKEFYKYYDFIRKTLLVKSELPNQQWTISLGLFRKYLIYTWIKFSFCKCLLPLISQKVLNNCNWSDCGLQRDAQIPKTYKCGLIWKNSLCRCQRILR